MSSFDPEGPLAQQLKAPLISELQGKYNISDDAEDVAEFILVLIGNNRTAADIVSEVRTLIDFPIDEEFVNSIFQEIGRMMQQGQPQQEQQAQQQQEPQQQVSLEQQRQAQQPQVPQPQAQEQRPQQNQQPPQEQKASSFQQLADKPPSPHASFHPMLAFPNKAPPSGPRNGVNKGGINKGGKNIGGGKKSFALQNPANFEKVMGLNNNTNVTKSSFNQRQPKGRCPDFPYCTNKECPLAHPTKVCFSYPNCPNPPGTCNYLHPDQDQELMAKLEQSKKEYVEKKKLERQQQYQQQQQQWVPPITLCKFGHHCAKESCPFGHPTPANQNAVVGQLEWCSNGKTCADGSCVKAHPSPNYQSQNGLHGGAGAGPGATALNAGGAPAAPIPTLEQCKFGAACTNYKCPKRHASTPVVCREGANCKRLDCFFSHPIDEDCRFGANCTNKTCMFRHPEGRSITSSNTWTKDGGEQPSVTQERQFAVPDDQVMEQAIQN